MKTSLILIIFCFFWIDLLAQVPQAFKYQAVARDLSGLILANKSVSFKISILSGNASGPVIFSETHGSKTTNAFGLVDLEIGRGTPVTGTFLSIPWGTNMNYVKIEMDPNGGSSYSVMGTSQFLSVPYAMYAKTAENIPGGNSKGDMLYWNGTKWEVITSPLDGQVLRFINGTPAWCPATPLITTVPVSNITDRAAACGGNITSDTGDSALVRGVCWSTSLFPTIADNKTTDGAGKGAYTSNLTGLTGNTSYYIRAYAINSQGVGYGNQLTFTTQLTLSLATVTTSAAAMITTTGASLGGNVINDGNVPVTERGIVYSTSVNPATSNTKIAVGSGLGSFSIAVTGLTSSTIYYVRAYAINSQGTSYGSQITFTTSQAIVLPTVITNSVAAITQTTATCGGNVSSDGGAAVTARGVVWSTSQNPTRENKQGITYNGTDTGSFSSNLTGLTANTPYYVRAYATNSQGTAYGSQVTFTTSDDGTPTGTFVDFRDGKTYKWVKIGNQTWMAENLAWLPVVSPSSAGSLTLKYYYIYGYNGSDVGSAKATANYTTYGVLYNWPAAMDGAPGSSANPSGIRGACPTGWHLPSDAEWTSLSTYLGGESIAGGKMKETGTAHWLSPNTGATNESGFSGLPGGFRSIDGTFGNVGSGGYRWSSTEYSATLARGLGLYSENTSLSLMVDYKDNGFSVRCLKD
jgi:uncharacterized protein (TIGR02145 family)